MIDPVYLAAMTKLAEGFALADRITTAARSGDSRLLAELVETAADDNDIAAAVIARLASYLSGRTPAEMADAAHRANIPPPLDSAPNATAGGILLP